MARLVPQELQAEALFHDCAESLLNDVPGPCKKFLPDYKRMEADVYFVIMMKLFDRAILDVHPAIKQADQDSQCAEAWQFFPTASVHPAPSKEAREGLHRLLEKPVTLAEAVRWARELLDL